MTEKPSENKNNEENLGERNQQEQHEQEAQNNNNEQNEQLSQADKEVYNKIFQSLNKIDKKVQKAKNKLNQQETQSEAKNLNFKEIAEKLIQSKQNSQIVNKEDILSDINQSFQRAVIDIYSQNQKLKKKMIQMQKIIKQQNHKIFEQQTKQQNLNKQIQTLRFELAQLKDDNMLNNRHGKVPTTNQQQTRKQPSKKSNNLKTLQNQNQDYDFWNMPQNDNNYGKKKKQFIENSGLWVNQKNIGDSMFITEGRK